MRFATLFWIGGLWLGLAVPAGFAGQPEDDEATLKEAGVSTRTPDLVAFFRKRVMPETDTDRVRALIKKLGDDTFQVREKATKDLIALGPGILRLLREGTRNSDYEVANRSKQCLAIVEKTSALPLVSAAVRLLGARKPPEGARVLLAFAPFADAGVADPLRVALRNLALRDGKPDAALTAAKNDKQPVRRALAAETLIRVKALGGAGARKYLKDASPLVRLRTALALAEAGDRASVPALVNVLSDVPLDQAWLAEDVLCRLAGDKAPQVSLGDDAASRKRARDAWERWWKQHGARTNLATLKGKAPYLGLTLVAFQNHRGQGEIMELGRDGKKRWGFGGLNYPVDFQVLGTNRILLAEMQAHRVSVRDRTGRIVWQKRVQQPISCQRLANGNTFVASPNGVYEFDAHGKQVFTYNRGRWDIMGARKHTNGEYILMTRTHLVRVNAKGQEVKSFPAGRNYQYCSFEVLPNGNLLVPLHRNSQVAEMTLDGKKVWSASVALPTSARRLPNGNVVAASLNYQRVVEVDRSGKTVKTTTISGMPWCVQRR